MEPRSPATSVGHDPEAIPTAFVSYAQGDDAWNTKVLQFAIALRKVGGIDCDVDAWHLVDSVDWTTFGPAAIRENDVTLLAVSPTYKAVWEGDNEDRNAGAAGEIGALKALCQRDRAEFRRRVKVVLLPDVTTDSIPDELSGLRRFAAPSFDMAGLEDLLRSILQKPPHEKPVLGPQPALPPRTVAELRGETLGDAEPVGPVTKDGGDRAIADLAADRVAALDSEIESGELDTETAERRRDERAKAQATHVAIERALPPVGASRQRMIGDLLSAQLYFSAGAYQAAEERFKAVTDALEDEAADPPGSVLEPRLRELGEAMLTLNDRMRTQRYAATTKYRHPEPPELPLDPHRTWGMTEYYECARSAMRDASEDGPSAKIRKAILRGREPAEEHAGRLYPRWTAQQWIAHRQLGIAEPSDNGYPAGAYLLERADLQGTGDRVAADVLLALAEAHLEIHAVERGRSGPVRKILDRSKAQFAEDKRRLRRSIVLNTYALSITESLPWIFAASEAEREEVQLDEAKARRRLSPTPAMWHSRQVTLLALYRRSHGFRLLGDHERAYMDLRMLQRVGRLTRMPSQDNDHVTGWVDTLEALAEYRIGELYRVDHDYMQALVHLCRSHDAVRLIERREESAIAKELAHLEIKLSLGKGKAFFEIGSVKRSLKWHLNAWRRLLAMHSPTSELAPKIKAIEDELDRAKHDPVLYKGYLQDKVRPVLEQMCEHDLDAAHHALEADILVRISHLLTVLRLPEDNAPEASNGDSAALRCLKRAGDRDKHNLSVKTGLLRYEMRRRAAATGDTVPAPMPAAIADLLTEDPLDCWPSGPTDVDQVIRAAEHLMLERLYATGDPGGTDEKAVAQALMAHFTTHTDSINLRGAILHRYLMRQRIEDDEPWYVDTSSKTGGVQPVSPEEDLRQYLEFVCLRRFGSFTPFMPRPAAVSAVGGGYLVRTVRPPAAGGDGPTTMFNVVVDPGEGAVNNLYAMGLSIADIDMVVATHDHPEHLAALDAILTLRRELRERAQTTSPTRSMGPKRLLVLGNRSVVNRYSFLNGDDRHLVLHIADATVVEGGVIPAGVSFNALRTKHEDLGGAQAVGFVLGFVPEGTTERLTIAFTSDTGIEALRKDGDPTKLDPCWEEALASDIVVAHTSDVPSSELRTVAELRAGDDKDAVAKFEGLVRKLARERPEIASQLMHALSLAPSDHEDGQDESRLSKDALNARDQLYLTGLLEVCAHMRDRPRVAGGSTRILIVGELREQLGSFRGTIAREINRRILGLPDARHGLRPGLVALTADIGLRIRLAAGGDKGRSSVLCSTCSYNNDRLDSERFHPPHDIYEVCVKGDHEAMYWNCDGHNPGTRVQAMFVEQMGGYNPFAAGGRYHG